MALKRWTFTIEERPEFYGVLVIFYQGKKYKAYQLGGEVNLSHRDLHSFLYDGLRAGRTPQELMGTVFRILRIPNPDTEVEEIFNKLKKEVQNV